MELLDARPGDAGRLSCIHAASWRAGYRGLIDQAFLDAIADQRWTSLFASWLGEGKTRALLATDGGADAGCVLYGPARDELYPGYLPNWGEIISLYVLPQAWRQGCGTALIGEALARLRAAQTPGCFLWVLQENQRARRFYEAQGFVETADTIEVPMGLQLLTDVRYVLAF